MAEVEETVANMKRAYPSDWAKYVRTKAESYQGLADKYESGNEGALGRFGLRAEMYRHTLRDAGEDDTLNTSSDAYLRGF